MSLNKDVLIDVVPENKYQKLKLKFVLQYVAVV